MELRDLIVTPLTLIVVYAVALWIRPRVTDSITRKYFLPALTVRIIGALAVGFLYQFYYEGGDTFNFHTHGSRIIWEAFTDDPTKGARLLFGSNTTEAGLYKYTSTIWYFKDTQSYFIVRIAAFFDLFTFSSYSATAILFSVLSFVGAWMMFLTFYRIAPELQRWAALSCLFIPTVFFWGSGIFKDTVTLAALGIAFYCVYRILIGRWFSWTNMFVLLFSVWVIYSIKKYILLSFLPVIIVWFAIRLLSKVHSDVLRFLMVPITMMPVLFLAYYVIIKVGEDDPRYKVANLAVTAQITAYDIRYGWGARTGEGSGYTLGELDGTWQSMLRLAPAAVNVSLFRPYIWEVRNPLMVLSALESLIFLVLTVFVFYKIGVKGLRYLVKPEVLVCLGFSVMFAFAVGVSTFNFGTLSRYKIPLLPFYAMGIGLLYHYSKSDRKVEVLELTE